MMAVHVPFAAEELFRCPLGTYHRMIEAGAFDEDDRVELLDGELVTMSPKIPAHEAAVRRPRRSER